MTRATATLHDTVGYELSAASAFRILRRLTCEEWEVYRSPAVEPVGPVQYTQQPELPVERSFAVAEAEDDSELWDVTGVDDGELWDVTEAEEDTELFVVVDLRDMSETAEEADPADDVTMPATSAAVTPAEVARAWYLNEVPAEWFDDACRGDRSAASVPT